MKQTIIFLFLFSVYFSNSCLAEIYPYLQDLTSNSVEIYWETNEDGSRIYLSEANNEKIGPIEPELISVRKKWKKDPFKLYRVNIKSLNPETKYFYEIKTKDSTTGLYRFKTLPLPEKNQFSFLVISDAQRGQRVTKQVIDQSLIPNVFLNSSDRGESPVAFTLFPGDLVQWGFIHKLWHKQFFFPLKNLLVRTPIIPAIGNHEYNSWLFYNYFYEGNKKNKSHYFDRFNSRFITLSTNFLSRRKAQLKWLELTLQNAKDKNLKYIILQYHHPSHSEVWPRGEKKYSRKVEEIVENFAETYDGHIVIFNGHTHAYSRGHHPRLRITNIINGPLGGKIDYWNNKSKDYPNYIINDSYPGWTLVTINNDSLSLRHYRYDKETNLTTLFDKITLKSEINTVTPPQVISTNRSKGKVNIKLEDQNLLSVELTLSSSNKEYKYLINYRNDTKNKVKRHSLENITINVPKNLVKSDLYYSLRGRSKNLIWSKSTGDLKL